uniref:Uncharacterized protein n=1 Tax=Candidatus Kentrum sp. LPFa TaxID=2126335 RepID=A0A450WK79_9GAMM|nr:MAG: hypothetical protein BECKLPF1236B_GA0070989_111711 [Candidatus Kentron sp. LPFa]
MKEKHNVDIAADKKIETDIDKNNEEAIEELEKVADKADAEPKKTASGHPILKELTLPSGKKATFLKRRGVALLNAQRKMKGDPSLMTFAMLSETVEIDGKPVLMEAFQDEFDLFDVLTLNNEFSDLGKSSPMPGL